MFRIGRDRGRKLRPWRPQRSSTAINANGTRPKISEKERAAKPLSVSSCVSSGSGCEPWKHSRPGGAAGAAIAPNWRFSGVDGASWAANGSAVGAKRALMIPAALCPFWRKTSRRLPGLAPPAFAQSRRQKPSGSVMPCQGSMQINRAPGLVQMPRYAASGKPGSAVAVRGHRRS